MPLYEYQCETCGRRTEKIQKFSDPELTVCPHCGGKLERTITAPSVQFAGGGWYKDLYSSAKPAGGTQGGSSESKPASAEGGGTSSGDSASKAAPTSAPAASAATPTASKS